MTTIAVLKEVKNGEGRVGLTPTNVKELVDAGHKVVFQSSCGVAAGWSDDEYSEAGGVKLEAPEDIVGQADIVVKVKEPVEDEFHLLELMEGKTLFTFLHLADNPELAKKLLEYKIIGVSYDTIEDKDGNLPLLKPMSELAGKFAARMFGEQIKSKEIKRVLVLGGGVAGTSAAREAIDIFGCHDVVVYEKNESKAKNLRSEVFYDDPVDVFSCDFKVSAQALKADLIIGCALVKGAKAPEVLSKTIVDSLKHGTKIVDIAIDQGGCVYGSRPTTHSGPTYEHEGKTFCCVPNMPGAYPREAVEELTKLSFPIVMDMANKGTFKALFTSTALAKGLNTVNGLIVNPTVSKELGFSEL